MIGFSISDREKTALKVFFWSLVLLAGVGLASAGYGLYYLATHLSVTIVK